MKTIERVSFVAGVLLFGALLYRVGPATVADNLRRIGWGFSWILAQQLVAVCLNTLAWRSAIPRIWRPSFPALSRILVAADGFNAVAPSAVIGGELIRVSLLRRTVAGTTAAASVILAAAIQFLAQVLFILIGTPILLGESLHRPFRNTLLVLLAVFLLILAGSLVLASLGNPFQRLRRLLLRVGIGRKRIAGESAWRSLDEEIFGAFRERPRDLLSSLVLFFLGWASGAIEIYLLLLFLGSRARLEVVSDDPGAVHSGRWGVFLRSGEDRHTGSGPVRDLSFSGSDPGSGICGRHCAPFAGDGVGGHRAGIARQPPALGQDPDRRLTRASVAIPAPRVVHPPMLLLARRWLPGFGPVCSYRNASA